jgi:hypothetical protein
MRDMEERILETAKQEEHPPYPREVAEVLSRLGFYQISPTSNKHCLQARKKCCFFCSFGHQEATFAHTWHGVQRTLSGTCTLLMSTYGTPCKETLHCWSALSDRPSG